MCLFSQQKMVVTYQEYLAHIVNRKNANDDCDFDERKKEKKEQ